VISLISGTFYLNTFNLELIESVDIVLSEKSSSFQINVVNTVEVKTS